jgi:hypothetical protein
VTGVDEKSETGPSDLVYLYAMKRFLGLSHIKSRDESLQNRQNNCDNIRSKKSSLADKKTELQNDLNDDTLRKGILMRLHSIAI